MTPNSDQPNNSNKSSLAGTILDRIKTEHLEPKPRWHFIFSEFSMWGIWTVSVLIGAAAFAVMLYVSVDAGYAFYEATHETWIEFVIEAAPWLWLGIFTLMAGLAYYNVRCTKKGYRYPVSRILLSSLVLSVIGGAILHQVSGGLMIEAMLAEKIPMYTSYEKLERSWWLKPDDGLLIGHFITESASNSAANFLDINEREWVIVTDELLVRDLDILHSGDVVKVIGLRGSTSASVFHGCGVFPWMHSKPHTRQDMREGRESFVRMMNEYKERLATNLIINRELEANEVATNTNVIAVIKVCPTMPLVKKALRKL